MDPRIAWYPPEQLGTAHDIWTKIWETQLGLDNMNLNNTKNRLNNSIPNVDMKPQDYISLDYKNNLGNKYGTINRCNVQNQQYQLQVKRKRENRASTYGLNHSSCKHLLGEDGGLTPWQAKDVNYTPGVIG